MNQIWANNINEFIEKVNKHKVKMLMIGGGAVNFHGYQRHSADVDFWLDMTEQNIKKLVEVFKELKYEIDDFPKEVYQKKQNISIKFSPVDLNLELITNFSINKPFENAYKDSVLVEIDGNQLLKWNVLSLEDLITSKVKAGRPKDILDINELKKINNL